MAGKAAGAPQIQRVGCEPGTQPDAKPWGAVDWRGQIMGMLERIDGLLSEKWVAIAAAGTSLFLLLALIVVTVRYARLRHILEVGGVLGHETAADTTGQSAPTTLERGSRALVDRL